MAVASFLWQHRGSVLRATDLLRRAPRLVQDGRGRDAVTEAKAIIALDAKVPTSTEVRITGFEGGSMTLRGGVPADRLEQTRTTLLGVDQVVDVRTGDVRQPTVDDAVAADLP